jgi:AraC-like DNA-binding protein
MVFLTYLPRPPTADFVELFWYADGPAPTHARERVLPTGDAQLVIGLGDTVLRVYDDHDTERAESYRGPLVCGPRSQVSIIDAAATTASMGVRFKPGGAFPFLDAPAGELHNLNVPLESLWRGKAGDLHDRLLEARTPAACFRILEQMLLEQLVARRELHPAVAYALREFQTAPGSRTIAEVTERTGFSPKWFTQLFTAQVGLTPKLFCRLRRFQAALAILGGPQRTGRPDLALTCGYYDQAHFNRDFRAFAGMTPTEYLAARREHPNHVRTAE